MNARRAYQAALLTLAAGYWLFSFFPREVYMDLYLVLAWFPAHWLVYKLIKVT